MYFVTKESRDLFLHVQIGHLVLVCWGHLSSLSSWKHAYLSKDAGRSFYLYYSTVQL